MRLIYKALILHEKCELLEDAPGTNKIGHFHAFRLGNRPEIGIGKPV
jgi:hypothetical protein